MTNINWDDSPLHFQPQTLGPAAHGIPLPVYGNYGGVNWSAGQVGGHTPDNPDLSNPLEAPKDDLDLLYHAHDLVYQQYEDGIITDQTQLREADVDLILSTAELTFTDPGATDPVAPNYDPEAGIYSGFATLALVGQLAATGYLQTLSPVEQFAIAEATQEALVNLEAGLAAEPSEGRSLHGALHVFEAQYLDLLV
jgi:hypothetical protein